jgi:hypothetical protein
VVAPVPPAPETLALLGLLVLTTPGAPPTSVVPLVAALLVVPVVPPEAEFALVKLVPPELLVAVKPVEPAPPSIEPLA